ncbi:hypothetical protein YC2023_028795 [Brassica napus]
MQDKLTQIFIYITPLFISYTLIKHVSLLLSLSIISKDVFKFFRTILTHTHEISFVPQNTYPRSYPSPLKVLTSHTFLKLSIIDALTTRRRMCWEEKEMEMNNIKLYMENQHIIQENEKLKKKALLLHQENKALFSLLQTKTSSHVP